MKDILSMEIGSILISVYFYALLDERRKFIFPVDWDLSEIEASGTGRRGVLEYEDGNFDRMYGPTWNLDNVARETINDI